MSNEFFRNLGFEVSGAKNDKSAVAVLDFYPKTERLILSEIEFKLSGIEEMSSDDFLLQTLQSYCPEGVRLNGCGVHGPLDLPPQFLESLADNDPAHPKSQLRQDQIAWMIEQWRRLKPSPRPFSTYHERPCEIFLRYLTKEKFLCAEALGANLAPITARLQVLKSRLPHPLHEVNPRATLARLISSLGVNKNLYRDFSDLEKGVSVREKIFAEINKKAPQLFIYEKDLELMILNLNCFYAFLCAFQEHLIARDLAEVPPKNFPKGAGWIYLPKISLSWEQVFSNDFKLK